MKKTLKIVGAIALVALVVVIVVVAANDDSDYCDRFEAGRPAENFHQLVLCGDQKGTGG